MNILNKFSLMIVLLSMISSCTQKNSIERPNIIWIIAEDVSSPDLGVYGNELVNTPNIDRLAREGMKFTNVFTTSPDCTPSRTALAVGMHQGSIGAHHKRYPNSLKPVLPEAVQTMNTHYQENGFVTANIKDTPGTGKTDWAFEANLSSQFKYESWDELTQQEKPFFAQVSINNAHRPFLKVENADLDDIENIPPYYPDHPVVKRDFVSYYKSIEQLDVEVGNVLAALDRHGVRENTIVFFFSDHGRPFTRGKSSLYDSGIKIPAIIYIPDQLESPQDYQSDSIDDRLISAIDFSATSLFLAGIEKPNNMHGRVFWGEKKDSDRKYVFSALDRTGESHFKSRAIRSGNFKYIRNYRHDFSINKMATAYTRQHHPIYHLLNILSEENILDPMQSYLVEDLPAEELYNVKEDPYEISNLINEPVYQDVISELRDRLERHLEEINDQGLQSDSEQIRRAFQEYGQQSYQQRKDDIEQLYQKVLQQVHSNYK